MVILGDVLLLVVVAYFLAGFAFAFRFAIRISGAVNERSRVSSPLFRLLLLPGATLLWPWLWKREIEAGASSRVSVERDEE